jgi:hypothetical protein
LKLGIKVVPLMQANVRLASMSAQQTQPIVVRVMPSEPAKETTAADVLIGAIGLTGVLLLVAIVLGGVLGGLLILFKRIRAKLNLEPQPDSEALKISPFP